jgi:DNA-binding NtrC family response regulator
LRSDARIVAASNRDLETSVAQGKFRADLLYRLRVVPIELPPLRDRDADLRVLALHFLSELSLAGQPKYFSPAALAALEDYSFPGNVRELRNAIQQAFILADEEIRIEHLPNGLVRNRPAVAALGNGLEGAARAVAEAETGPIEIALPAVLTDVERRVILATMQRLDGDKVKAAQSLGISLKTLYSRLREYAARSAA